MANKDRVISVEKTVRELQNEIYWNESTKVAIRAFLRTVPAVDAVEVVHGLWEYHDCVSSYDGTKSGYSCSECHAFVDEEIFDMDGFHKDFCGSCGAIMDGGNAE